MAGSHTDLEAVGEAYRWAAVREVFNLSAELVRLRPSDRVFAGQVCSHWIATKTITSADYVRALREFFELIDDTSVDVPKVWQYTAELISKQSHGIGKWAFSSYLLIPLFLFTPKIAPLLKDKHVTLRDILKVAGGKLIEADHCTKLIRVLFPHLVAEHGPQFVRDLWGDCEWQEFMPADEVTKFVTDNVSCFFFDILPSFD